MMKNRAISERIIFGFGTLLALLLVMTLTNGILLHTITTHLSGILDDAMPGLKTSAQARDNASECQLSLLRHMIAKTDEERKPFEQRITNCSAEVEKAFAEFEKSILREADRMQYKKTREAQAIYLKGLGQSLELSRAGKHEEAFAFNVSTVRPAFNEYTKELDALFQENADYGEASGAQIRAAARNATLALVSVSALSLLVGVTFALVIVGGLKKVLNQVALSLDDGSNQVSAAASQVSAASQSLAEGASEQAASLEETSSSLEEMASMTQRNAENAQKANTLTRQARAAADTGATDMQAMHQAMQDIKASSDEIGKIIKTIDEIAFQTNILALNAAVEAARAGEAGMGFAVVADEVRNLAQRCAQSAKETAEKIEGAITKTAQGVQLSAKVTQGLQEIVSQVRQVDELVAEVASASKEQSQGISQVNTAVTQMDKVTQSNAANAEESASAAEELSAQAEALKAAVGQLMRLVGGQSTTQSSPTTKRKASLAPTKAAAPAKAALRPQLRNNGNGHSLVQPQAEPALAEVGARRTEELPMPGDFKDF